MVIYLLTALFLGGFGNYLIPLMCGSRDMVFPYMNMLSFWFYLLAVLVLVAGLFVPGGPTGAGWTLYPPQAMLPGTPGATLGHHLHARLARDLHRRVHDGRPQLRDDGAAGALPRHDVDAHAAVGVGHFHGVDPRPAGVPGAVRVRDHDDARRTRRHQLLHAGGRCDGRDRRCTAAAVRCCSSICSGSSVIPRCTSSRCRRSASCPICSARMPAATSSAIA